MGDPATEWCWMVDGDEVCHGPFASRDEAVADARDVSDPRSDVLVGRVRRYDGSEYMLSVDQLLDAINEHASENDFAWCDAEPFDFRAGAIVGEAEGELRAWARKWLHCNTWTCDDDMQPADIGAAFAPSDDAAK